MFFSPVEMHPLGSFNSVSLCWMKDKLKTKDVPTE